MKKQQGSSAENDCYVSTPAIRELRAPGFLARARHRTRNQSN